MLRPGGGARGREEGRRRRAPAALALLALGALAPPACGGHSEPAAPPALLVEEIVTDPTATRVEIALVPAEDVELFASFGADGSQETARQRAAAGELAVLRIEDLAAGSSHRARVHLRRPGEDGFTVRPPVHFRTLHTDPAATVRFAYTADSHIVGRYLNVECQGRGADALANFERTLANVVAGAPDFVIAGGDNFMTHAPLLEVCPEFAAYGAGTVRTAAQADLRYRLGLSLWAPVARETAFLYTLGNHDGEARFGDAAGSYGHFTDTRALSRGARLRHLPDPTATYDGARDGALYYTFVSGSARIVVLDVMAGPTELPRSADDWTLGEAQRRWLERVLEENRAPWVFVFAEHLVGGVTSPDGKPFAHEGAGPGEYHYGRGGLRATVTGEPTGRFLGEQAELQALMARHGVDVFFHAHDHVAVIGEKPGADGRGEGVLYAMGGQASAGDEGPGWALDPWFAAQMDYDGDGRPDYDDGPNGSAAAGFYRVTVEGPARARLEYVRSDVDGAPVAFGRVLYADGRSEALPAEPE